MFFTDAGTALAAAVALGGLVMLACVMHAFGRAGRSRRELGPWSVALALLSLATALALLAYAFFAFGAETLPLFARGRNVFFALFLAAAQLAVLVLPLVLLQLPVSALLALAPAAALALVKLGEVLFFPSILAALTLPAVLVLEFVALRVAYGTGRVRARDEPLDEQYAHRHEAHGSDARKQWLGPHDAVVQRRVTAASPLLDAGAYGALEGGPGAVRAGATTLVSVSALAVGATLAESLLLAFLGADCSETYLHALMSVYAGVHGALALRTLAPPSTFV